MARRRRDTTGRNATGTETDDVTPAAQLGDDDADLLAILRAGGNWPTVERPSELQRSTAYVYFLQAEQGGHIKIGSTSGIAGRFKDLQCGNPEPLRLLAVIRCPKPRLREAELHRQFANARVRGEWFRSTDLLERYIARHAVPLGTDHMEQMVEHLDRIARGGKGAA